MNQSTIAMQVAQMILAKECLLHKWTSGNYTYGIYGLRVESIDQIKSAVFECTNIDMDEKTRRLEVINARRVFAFLSCYATGTNTLVNISRNMGTSNHATVLHHRNKMKDLISINDYTSIKTLNDVCNKLNLTFLKVREVVHED
jgi:chromosomal replication initiation ATPase DnaA